MQLPGIGSDANDAALRVYSEVVEGLSIPRYLHRIGLSVFPWQNEVLSDPATRICIDGARQGGKSTIMSAIACHNARFKPGSLCVILAPTLMQANEDMMKIKQFIARDKTYPRLVRSGAQEIALINGSRILVLTASDDAARGFSNPDIILFDEASRIPDDVFEAVRPMITNNLHARIYEISTPNGKKGFFYDHFNSPRWSRYLVRAPFSAVQGFNGPELMPITEEGAKSTLKGNLKPTAQAENIRFFFSPRHYNEAEQEDAISGMHIRKYQQEYGCEFVDAEDQVFSQTLIEQMFSSAADDDFIEPMTLPGEEEYADPDPEFMDEYEDPGREGRAI